MILIRLYINKHKIVGTSYTDSYFALKLNSLPELEKKMVQPFMLMITDSVIN